MGVERVESGVATFGVAAIATRGLIVVWGALCSGPLFLGPLSWHGLSPQVSALTHLTVPHDEQLTVDGDVVVLKLQQGHQLQAREQRQGGRLGKLISAPRSPNASSEQGRGVGP